jgi:hypothetical protein
MKFTHINLLFIITQPAIKVNRRPMKPEVFIEEDNMPKNCSECIFSQHKNFWNGNSGYWCNLTKSFTNSESVRDTSCKLISADLLNH